MKCEKCGSNMKSFIKGSSQVIECPNCGWNYVTTYIDPIHEDSTVYSIIIEQGNEVNAESIMEVKRYTNLTTPEIMNILLYGNLSWLNKKLLK